MKFFCKKCAFFRDFSVCFVIFNIKVKELEDRKITPILILFNLEILINKRYDKSVKF